MEKLKCPHCNSVIGEGPGCEECRNLVQASPGLVDTVNLTNKHLESIDGHLQSISNTLRNLLSLVFAVALIFVIGYLATIIIGFIKVSSSMRHIEESVNVIQ